MVNSIGSRVDQSAYRRSSEAGNVRVGGGGHRGEDDTGRELGSKRISRTIGHGGTVWKAVLMKIVAIKLRLQPMYPERK